MKLLIEQLPNLLASQADLNTFINGEEWIHGKSANGKVINWPLAMTMEAAELVDSLDWKHWKFMTPDIENAKMEIVDIMHHLFSDMVTNDMNVNYFKTINLGFEPMPEDINEIQKKDIVLERAIEVLRMSGEYMTICKEEPDSVKSSGIAKLIVRLYELMVALDFSSEEFIRLFKVKNAINMLRLQNGYLDGTYKKMWDETEVKEDNDIAIEIFRYVDVIKTNVEDLVRLLQGYYDTEVFNQ